MLTYNVSYIIINGNQSKDELYMIKGLNSEITCTSGSVFGTVNEPNHGTRIHTETVSASWGRKNTGEVYSVPERYDGCRFSLSANSWTLMKRWDKGSMRIFR